MGCGMWDMGMGVICRVTSGYIYPLALRRVVGVSVSVSRPVSRLSCLHWALILSVLRRF